MDAGFSPRADELPSIGAICRHLDGIPLAIEFAAAHASTFGLHRVAAGLHDRFALLTRGRRTALPRHRTLRGVLDWSYDLLSAAEQRLLRHLAVFSGGFTVEAAAAVVSDGDRRPLLRHGGHRQPRREVPGHAGSGHGFALVSVGDHPSLRGEKLDEHGERDAAARRHAAYFRDLFPRSCAGIQCRVSADDRTSGFGKIDNVRAALDWCFSAEGDRALGVELTAGYGLWSCVDVGIRCSTRRATSGNRWIMLTKALDTAEALDDLDAQARALVGPYQSSQLSAPSTTRHWQRPSGFLLVADRIGDVALSRIADRLMGNALVMLGRPREAQGFLERLPER